MTRTILTFALIAAACIAVASWRSPRCAPGTQLRYEFRMWRLDIRCRLRRRPVRAADGRPLDEGEQEAFGLIAWEYPVLTAAEPPPLRERA